MGESDKAGFDNAERPLGTIDNMTDFITAQCQFIELFHGSAAAAGRRAPYRFPTEDSDNMGNKFTITALADHNRNRFAHGKKSNPRKKPLVPGDVYQAFSLI